MQDCGHLANAWERGPKDVEAKLGITYLEGKVTQLDVTYVQRRSAKGLHIKVLIYHAFNELGEQRSASGSQARLTPIPAKVVIATKAQWIIKFENSYLVGI